MLNFTKILTFVLTVVIYNTISAQNHLKGFVKSSHTQQPLVGSTIKNLSEKKIYSTNKFGAFGILVNTKDTLLFSHIGYKDFYFVVLNTDSIVSVMLEPISYPLPAYTLKGHTSIEGAVKLLRTDSLLNHMETYTKWPKGADVIVGTGFICTGCINGIWYKYSKRGKEINAINRAVVLYQQQLRAEDKWVAFLLKYAHLYTNYSKSEINLCKPTASVLLQLTEYDLISHLKKCLQLH
jgi:hypothetical protein